MDDESTVTGFPGTPGRTAVPGRCPDLLGSVAQHVTTGQRRAVSAASAELLASCWAIGHEIDGRPPLWTPAGAGGSSRYRSGRASTSAPERPSPASRRHRLNPGPTWRSQATRDPYLFDFLGTTGTRVERDLEQALVDHVGAFLLELGQGFASMGRQVHLAAVDDLLAAAGPDVPVQPLPGTNGGGRA